MISFSHRGRLKFMKCFSRLRMLLVCFSEGWGTVNCFNKHLIIINSNGMPRITYFEVVRVKQLTNGGIGWERNSINCNFSLSPVSWVNALAACWMGFSGRGKHKTQLDRLTFHSSSRGSRLLRFSPASNNQKFKYLIFNHHYSFEEHECACSKITDSSAVLDNKRGILSRIPYSTVIDQ